MTIETISEVRYGDLIVPSQAEMAAGKLALESRKDLCPSLLASALPYHCE